MSLPDLQEPLRLLEQKELVPAVEVLERKVAALPAHLGAHVLLAHAYEAQERWDQALRAWEDVHLLMPNSPIANTGKRRVLRRMEGIADDASREAPAPSPPAQAPSSPPTPEAEGDPEASPDAADGSSAPDEDPPGLTQLRQQAEREARQGGARPGLADGPSSGQSSGPEDAPSPSTELTPTPEEQVEEFEDEENEDSLDQLIDDLESARIEPDPDAEADAPPAPDEPAAEDETEGVVSETLARIHETQEDYETAAHIYDQLADQEPDRADEFQNKAAEMRAKGDDAKS